jgi:hypothetical protein
MRKQISIGSHVRQDLNPAASLLTGNGRMPVLCAVENRAQLEKPPHMPLV